MVKICAKYKKDLASSQSSVAQVLYVCCFICQPFQFGGKSYHEHYHLHICGRFMPQNAIRKKMQDHLLNCFSLTHPLFERKILPCLKTNRGLLLKPNGILIAMHHTFQAVQELPALCTCYPMEIYLPDRSSNLNKHSSYHRENIK